jgi:hypothetical protein
MEENQGELFNLPGGEQEEPTESNIELSKNCQRFVASVMVALPFQNRQDEDQALEGIQ